MFVTTSSVSNKSVKPLTQAQERKLVTYLEERFLAITRAYKKRTLDTAPTADGSLRLRTLPAYIDATRRILSIILQIPPIDPSTSLRITFLLRLTGDIMTAIPGYPPSILDLSTLLEWLDDLDNAWVTVLRSQVWDPNLREGTDLVVPAESLVGVTVRSTPMSQTERTRLRSLLIEGAAGLEEWLSGIETGDEEDVQMLLENIGVQQSLDELFSGTLSEMGALGGSVSINDPSGMIETC